ncbi:MAG: pantoate--beta-alanine ligase [Cryobacterium sp.]|nr:pantoate--beta-alanine ligase [Oligoflexia bacterium]
MKILETTKAFQAWRVKLNAKAAYLGVTGGTSVGIVPTMGALHEGHRSLLKRARIENDFVVLTLFVNPTQFNQASDLEKYPKTLEADVRLAEATGVDAVFIPRDSEEMYPDTYRYQVSEKEFSKELCGASRPGHFEGMLTVVLKLLNLAGADRAYFGEKDFQQLTLIRGMAEAFFLPTAIVGCPTVREEDGLAMSSRNLRLTPAERKIAPLLHAALTGASDLNQARIKIENAGFKIDYLEDRRSKDGELRRFVAAYLGEVRLIDNVVVGVRV